MNPTPPALPDPNDVALIQQVFQLWNNGNQPGAIDTLRPRADAGLPWAAAFMAWLLIQQGVVSHPESVDWAIKAAELGAPWQAAQTFNNVVPNLPSNPHLAERLPELLQWAVPWTGGIDLVGQGWNLLAQGQPEFALRVMMTPSPWPILEPQLAAIAEQGRTRISELEELLAAARQKRQDFDGNVTMSSDAITKATDDLTTSAKQAGLLVKTVLSDATNALYKDDATRNEKESRGAWELGLSSLVWPRLLPCCRLFCTICILDRATPPPKSLAFISHQLPHSERLQGYCWRVRVPATALRNVHMTCRLQWER